MKHYLHNLLSITLKTKIFSALLVLSILIICGFYLNTVSESPVELTTSVKWSPKETKLFQNFEKIKSPQQTFEKITFQKWADFNANHFEKHRRKFLKNVRGKRKQS